MPQQGVRPAQPRQLGGEGDQRVVGYYDTLSKQLVFLGSSDPSPGERVTLAHELTHALEDQHFDLSRIDRMLAACDDEAFQAALAVVEMGGSHTSSGEDRVTESTIRGFWKGYREVMGL